MLIVKTELRILIYNLLITFLAADGGWPPTDNWVLFLQETHSNGVLFLQETHSCEKDEKSGMTIWKKHFSFCMEQQSLVELL